MVITMIIYSTDNNSVECQFYRADIIPKNETLKIRKNEKSNHILFLTILALVIKNPSEILKTKI